MESRIILTQADFSQNNIGRYVELSDLTKKVLAKQTQYEEGSYESIALNTFLEQLSANGFIGGESPLITDLFIPALASEHSQILYNIAYLDNNGYPTNVMTVEEQVADISSRKFEVVTDNNNIIGITHSNNEGQAIIPVKVYDGKVGDYYPSHSIIAYGTWPSSEYSDHILNNLANNYRIKFDSRYAKLQYINQPTNEASAAISMSSYNYGFRGVSLVNSNNETYAWEGIIDGGTLDSTTQDGDKWGQIKVQEGSKNFALSDYYIYGRSTRCAKVSLIIFSNYLTLNKMNELKSYVTELMSALHIPTIN